MSYTDLLAELEAIRARRHDRNYQDWLDWIDQSKHFTAWERAAWEAGAQNVPFTYVGWLDPFYGSPSLRNQKNMDAYRGKVKAIDGTLQWLQEITAIVRHASDELASDLDRYDERQARRRITDAELDRQEQARDAAAEMRTWENGE